MIASVRGTFVETDGSSVVIAVQGIGYELLCSNYTIDFAQASEDIVHLYAYTHVREDALQLFGFQSKSEKELFLSLVKVNGVGPKMAIGILSAAPSDNILQMIDDGDVKALVKLPKVGKKTAEQMVLTLKGKLVLADDNVKKVSIVRKEVVSGLVNLGFKLTDVEFVVNQMAEPKNVQEGIRSALAALSS